MFIEKQKYDTWNQKEQIEDKDENDSKRPPNAFILYSKEKRSRVRSENPTFTNIEISRVLGKMWKEEPNEIKLKYKNRAADLQKEFKKEHPEYTYKKTKRKRILNDLIAYQSFPMFEHKPYYPEQFGQYANSLQGNLLFSNGTPLNQIQPNNYYSGVHNFPASSNNIF